VGRNEKIPAAMILRHIELAPQARPRFRSAIGRCRKYMTVRAVVGPTTKAAHPDIHGQCFKDDALSFRSSSFQRTPRTILIRESLSFGEHLTQAALLLGENSVGENPLVMRSMSIQERHIIL